MAYTVKKLAKLSGVSVRTLHWYDEIGLLKPAYYGANGYRFYEETQLLILQQILFFRELGIELKQIKRILGKSDFDKMVALSSHRQVLHKNLERTHRLIKTIDKTIKHLKGSKKMKEEEMYDGFITKEKQAEYTTYLKNRFGENNPAFAQCEKNCKNWKKENAERARQECHAIFSEFAKQKDAQFSPNSTEVQAIVRKLYAWVKQFWTPDKDSFPSLGQMYTELEWKKFFGKFDPHHPKLAMFIADGMKIFAQRELS